MKNSWTNVIELGSCWALEIEADDGYVFIELGRRGSEPKLFETREEARRNAKVWSSRDYIKCASVIRVCITKED